MSNKKAKLYLGVIVVVLVAIFGYAIWQTLPKETEIAGSLAYEDGTILGSGETHIYVSVMDSVNQSYIGSVEVYTDKEYLDDALEEFNFIAGDEGDYGLYVTSVNGVTIDYDTDGTYWAFYINGEMAPVGVSSTICENEASYMFQIEEG